MIRIIADSIQNAPSLRILTIRLFAQGLQQSATLKLRYDQQDQPATVQCLSLALNFSSNAHHHILSQDHDEILEDRLSLSGETEEKESLFMNSLESLQANICHAYGFNHVLETWLSACDELGLNNIEQHAAYQRLHNEPDAYYV